LKDIPADYADEISKKINGYFNIIYNKDFLLKIITGIEKEDKIIDKVVNTSYENVLFLLSKNYSSLEKRIANKNLSFFFNTENFYKIVNKIYIDKAINNISQNIGLLKLIQSSLLVLERPQLELELLN
jgi:hypothetical protein